MDPETSSGAPRAGDWTRDPSWGEWLAQCLCPDEARRGLDLIRAAIPPDRFDPLARPLPGKPPHPLLHDYIWRGRRFGFLEFAVAVERFRPRRLGERVRNGIEYLGLRAELLAGLTLSSTGATMRHEPLGRTGSADWLATWPTGERLFIEVKGPRASMRSRRFEWVTIYFHCAFMDAIDRSDRVRTDTGTWVRIDLDDDFVRECSERRIVNDAGEANHAAFAALAAEAMSWLLELTWPAPDGRYSIGRAGAVHLRRGAGAEPRFHFSGNVIPSDEEHETGRLRDDLDDAARQLARADAPGLVVLDTCQDGQLRNRVDEIQGLLRGGSWGRRLAGVLVLGRRVNGTPDCVATFVPGERAQVARPMLEGFHLCEHGHFHAHSGVFRVAQCPGPLFL